MTEEHLHPGDGATADLAVTRAERTMARRRVGGRFELAARNGGFATAIAVYAALTIAGAWLRTRLVPQAWQAAAAWMLVAVLAWAWPWLSWVSGRKPPGWAVPAQICERAQAGQIPAQTMGLALSLPIFRFSGLLTCYWAADNAAFVAAVPPGRYGQVPGLARGRVAPWARARSCSRAPPGISPPRP